MVWHFVKHVLSLKIVSCFLSMLLLPSTNMTNKLLILFCFWLQMRKNLLYRCYSFFEPQFCITFVNYFLSLPCSGSCKHCFDGRLAESDPTPSTITLTQYSDPQWREWKDLVVWFSSGATVRYAVVFCRVKVSTRQGVALPHNIVWDVLAVDSVGYEI